MKKDEKDTDTPESEKMTVKQQVVCAIILIGAALIIIAFSFI